MIGVYRFLDINNQVIYVGKATGGIKERLKNHNNSANDSLHYLKCYREVDRVEFIKCESKSECELLEKYYINIYNPKYNIVKPKIKKKDSVISPNKDLWQDYGILRTVEEIKLQHEILRLSSEYYLKYKSNILECVTDYFCYLDGILTEDLSSMDQINYYYKFRDLKNRYDEIALKFHKSPYIPYYRKPEFV